MAQANINKVLLTGNLTRDPELRATQGGMQILNFGIAANDVTKDAQGQWGQRPNFIDCVMFGNRAEAVSRYIQKGSKVAIEGKLRYSSWEQQDGQKRSKLEVVVDSIEFMSGKGQQQPQQGYQTPQPQPQRQEPMSYTQDIPF
jgi:single-strand DNA-binding protein